MRRKGEQQLVRSWPEWGPDHAVAQAIRRGDNWFTAWQQQACTTWARITKVTGIPAGRFHAFNMGALPTGEEISALAALWACPIEQVQASVFPEAGA